MYIALTNVYVDSPSKAFEFYTKKLGFIERMYMPEANLAIVASAEDPNGASLLLEPNDNPIAKTYQQALFSAGIPAIVFGTDDIEADFKRLVEEGVIFRKPPVETEYGKQALFEDSCGNLIQLYQA